MLIFIVILIIAVLGFGGYFAINLLKDKLNKEDTVDVNNKQENDNNEIVNVKLDDYTVYIDDSKELGFNFVVAKVSVDTNKELINFNLNNLQTSEKISLNNIKKYINKINSFGYDISRLNIVEDNIVSDTNNAQVNIMIPFEKEVDSLKVFNLLDTNKFDINDRDLEWLEYFREQMEDNFEKQGETMAGYMNSMAIYENDLAILNDDLAKLEAARASGELSDADYQKGLESINEKLLETLQNIDDIKQAIEDLYANALEKFEEEIEKEQAKIDDANESISQYIELLGMMGRGQNYKELAKFYESQYEVSLTGLKTQKAWVDELKTQVDYFEDLREQKGALSEEEQTQYDALVEHYQEANQELLSDTQNTLQAVADIYTNTVNDIFKTLDEQMGSLDHTLSELAENYAYYTEEHERYVTSSRQMYENSKMNRQIEDSIAGATTKQSKQMLKDLQEKINLQDKSNRLTQYDIDMNELQYQLALKKMALEDAQNAKDTVQLTRDDNGNYIYRYTTDEDKMAQKQQEYEDVLQQINDLAANRVAELEQQYLDAEQNYYAKAQEIANDDQLTREEKIARIEELGGQFAETLTYIQGQYGIATENLLTSNAAVSAYYGEQMVTSARELTAGINAEMESVIAGTDNIIADWIEKFGEGGEFRKALDEYYNGIDEVSQAAALTPVEMADALDRIVETSDDAGEKIHDLLTTIASEFDEINATTQAWVDHVTVLDDVIAHYQAMGLSINEVIKQLAAAEDLNVDVDHVPIQDYDPFTNDKDQDPSSVKQHGQWKNYNQNENKQLQGDLNYATTQLFENYATSAMREAAYMAQMVEYYASDAKTIAADENLTHDEKLAQIQQLFDSLDIESTLNMQMQAYLNRLNDLNAASVISNDTPYEQYVTINADFPGVTDQLELIDAFISLENTATQQANRSGGGGSTHIGGGGSGGRIAVPKSGGGGGGGLR